MIPGSNILSQALKVIASQEVTYYQFLSRALNNVGQDVAVYDLPVVIRGSFQPVPRNLYQVYGLNLQKSYFVFYVMSNILDVERDVSGDQIAFNNKRYQCQSNTPWFSIDGWKAILCCEVDNSETLLLRNVFGFNTSNPMINQNTNFEHGGFYE